MRRKISEFQVGLLTIVALVVLVGGMMWLKNIDLSKGSVMYMVDFSQVAGLRAGDKVQVRGIRMGEVTGLQILQGSVRVELSLEDDVDLREDAVVTLGEKGIVGEVVIEIDPGTGNTISEGHIFAGRTAGTIASMTDAAGSALAEMRILTGKVTELVDQVKSEGKFIETLVQANETLVKLDEMVVENQSDVENILDDLRVTSARFRELMESDQVEAAFDNAATTMATADSLMISLTESSTRLNNILVKIENGEGSAGMFVNDPLLYMKADSTMTSMKRLMDEIRRNPKRFVNLNLIDF
ncbi:MAG: phospholipid/cholesterol/gamma-HCH transport system substrate-binding protein [Candidatus Krumholzibacteriia bacterium]|jgi:phospholipid/cholesterol/gamma-HCH transport system substrate-binding protein